MGTTLYKANQGQIVVFLAVALVALLGFTALAVDGAMIYSDRRNAQNGADAAALAGAGMAAQYLENHAVMYENFSCSNSNVINAMNTAVVKSIERAQTNNFVIDEMFTDKNGVEVICSVQNTGPFLEQFIYVKVMITAPTNTSFAQLFYSGPVQSTVESIARVRPRTNLGFGYAVASIGNDCVDGGITGVGHVDIQTTNGGLFSNSCMVFSGNVEVHVDDPLGTGIYYYLTLTKVGSISVTPTPVQSPIQIPTYIVPPPECSILPAYGDVTVAGGSIETLNPGQYNSLTITGNAEVTLNPGLYCLSGDLLLTANQVLTGNEVTLYFLDGEFLSTANSVINLSAPTVDAPPAIPGMLIASAPDNTGTFTITGNSDSSYRGTVYIPNGTIESIGNSDLMGLKSQFVSKKVTLAGNTDINIEFEGVYNYQIPASVDLLK